MARKKIPLRYIRNRDTRRDMLRTRSQGLAKKADELATLCGIKACVIVFPEGATAPQVYSSTGEWSLLDRFMSLDKDSRFLKDMDQETFLLRRKGKLMTEAVRIERQRQDLESRWLLHRAMVEGSEGLSMEERAKVDFKVDRLLKSVSDRITDITGQRPVYHGASSSSHVQAPHFTGAQAPITHFTGGMHAFGVGSQALTHNVIGSSMDITGALQAPILPQFTGGMEATGSQALAPQFTDSIDITGAQAPIPHFTGGMETTGSQALASQITASMDITGAQPQFTGGMEATGSQASPQQDDTCLDDLMRSGGGDLDDILYGRDSKGGAATSAPAAAAAASAGLDDDEMMQTLDSLLYGFRGADPGPSSSYFLPPM